MLKTEKSIKDIEILSKTRKFEILGAKDSLEIKGTVYYVSNSGNDSNDGKPPETAWQTLNKVSSAPLMPVTV